MADSLRKKVTSGVAWNGSARVATRGFQAVVTVILARLLQPADFGVVGMTALFTGFIAMFTELGLTHAVMQARDVRREQLNTLFWAMIAASAGVWLVAFAAAPGIAAFFRMPLLSRIVPVSAAGFVIGSVNTVPAALLARDLDFRSRAYADIGGSLGFGIAAIGAALGGWGPWSLVAGSLVQVAIQTVVLCVRARWLPGVRLAWRESRSLFVFGLKALGVNIATYARANVDYLVIGRFIGAAPLGQYTLAFKMADFPRARLTPIFTHVAFPAFCSVADDVARVRSAYIRAVRLVALTMFPLLAGAALMAYEIVLVVYGAKWLPAVFPARVLLLMGSLLAIGEVSTTVIVSQGKPGLQLLMSLGYTATVAVLVLAALPFGIDGVAIGVSAGTILYFLILVRFANRPLGVPLRAYAGSLRPALAGCAWMALALLVLGRVAPSPAVRLCVAVPLGAGIYWLGVGRDARGELRSAASSVLAPLRRRLVRAPAPTAATAAVAESERG